MDGTMDKVRKYAELFGGVFERILDESELKNNNLDKALSWLDSGLKTEVDENIRDWINSKILDKLANAGNKFLCCCHNGYISVAKWLYDMEDVSIYDSRKAAFRITCRNGYLEFTQWLYELGGVDIHANNEYVFIYACYFGHLSVAQWLYELGGINIHAQNNYAFHYAYSDVLPWLKSL